MLYRITNGTLSAGAHRLLSHFDFEIKGRERIAVVGKNGAGKTTLLRLIAGELSVDRDDKRTQPVLYMSRNLTIGMLSQHVFEDMAQTVSDVIMASCPETEPYSRERYDYTQRYDRMLTAFGFSKTDKERRLETFSGGELTRIALIRLLLSAPDILLLDEPTNHLDLAAVQWLERYLKTYPGAVVEASHDRFFLDETATVIYEIEGGRLVRYAGNYTHYRQEKLKRRRIQEKTWQRQQEEIAREEALIRKFKGRPRKAAFARSRKTLLDRMERVEKPAPQDCHIFTGELTPAVIGPKWVLTAKDLEIGYQAPIVPPLSLRVKRGQKIAVIGKNGAGKTTFLKTLAGLLAPVGGKYFFSDHVEAAYFDQHSADIAFDGSVLEYFMKPFPSLTEKDARHALGAFLFSGTDVFKPVGALSGGERARLVLAALLHERPNMLLLDEPTNHMDIAARETIESAFKAYTGTMIFVSHDRYFIDQVADALLVFEDGRAMWYPFSYRHFLERMEKAARQGRLPAGMTSAEDQALIEGLKSVPKGSSLLGHELKTEQLYDDWRMRLAVQAMREAEMRVSEIQEKADAFNDKQLEKSLTGDADQIDRYKAEKCRLDSELEAAVVLWHQAIMAWYDLLSEIDDQHT